LETLTKNKLYEGMFLIDSALAGSQQKILRMILLLQRRKKKHKRILMKQPRMKTTRNRKVPTGRWRLRKKKLNRRKKPNMRG